MSEIEWSHEDLDLQDAIRKRDPQLVLRLLTKFSETQDEHRKPIKYVSVDTAMLMADVWLQAVVNKSRGRPPAKRDNVTFALRVGVWIENRRDDFLAQQAGNKVRPKLTAIKADAAAHFNTNAKYIERAWRDYKIAVADLAERGIQVKR